MYKRIYQLNKDMNLYMNLDLDEKLDDVKEILDKKKKEKRL